MAKSKPGKSVYIKREIADILQQIKDAKQEDRLLTFLSQNLELILDENAAIPVIPSDISDDEEEKVIRLNEDQENAIRVLNDWFNSDKQTATLSGAGGTGKTFTVGYWIKQLRCYLQDKLDDLKPDDLFSYDDYDFFDDDDSRLWDFFDDNPKSRDRFCDLKDTQLALGSDAGVLFLAPTHKAKNVLDKSLKSCMLDFPVKVYTVAQALGKQPVIDSRGEEEFIGKGDSNFIEMAQLVIIDEASMVSKEDYHHILTRATKVLFMGDKNQLPPVGESEALAFVDIPDCELKKVMRYSGHILSECDKLREGVEKKFIYTIKSDGKQIIKLKHQDALTKAIDLFSSEQFEKDSTFCRIVAYRNKIVDSNNSFIKPKVYGRDDDYFEGLRLIAAKPIQRKSISLINNRKKSNNEVEWDIYCNNSEELIITSNPEVVEIDESLLVDMPKDCKELEALIGVGKATRFGCLSENGLSFNSIILDKEAYSKKQKLIKDIKKFYQEEQDLIKNIKKVDRKEKERLQERGKIFKNALIFLYRWGDELKDIFCSTVHKAQGSTYNHVFICLDDILKPPFKKEFQQSDDRPKLLYTAVSRASEKVYLID